MLSESRPSLNVLIQGRNKEKFMKNTLKIFVLGAVISLLTACGEPKLDTSSDETMTASIQEIMGELSIEDQEKFEKTIMGIYVLTAMSSFGNDVSPEEAKAKIDEELNGKTAKEIFAIADEIKAEMENKG